MNAQEHIDTAEQLLKLVTTENIERATLKVRAAEAHIKLAKWKYRHGEVLF